MDLRIPNEALAVRERHHIVGRPVVISPLPERPVAVVERRGERGRQLSLGTAVIVRPLPELAIA